VDYLVSLTWHAQDENWTKTVEQISPHQRGSSPEMKYLYGPVIVHPNFSNSQGRGSHVDISADLGSIGYPHNYQVLSRVTVTDFENNENGNCSLSDFTNWVNLPPPKIFLSVIPPSVSIRPGDEKTVQVLANSSVDTPSEISLDAATSKRVLKLNFSSPIISLPPNGVGSSTLRIRAPNDLIQNENGTEDDTINILGNLSFPTKSVDTLNGISYTPSEIYTPTLRAFSHVTVSNPTPLIEQMTQIFHTSASTATEFAGLITTLGGMLGSLGVLTGWLIKRRQKKSRDKSGKM
jgi:hypothetical protein